MAILEVTLKTGRSIWANSIFIQATYAGLLEGYPNSRLNDRLIALLPQAATHLFGDGPLKVIEPTRYTKEVTLLGVQASQTPIGPAEFLPSCRIATIFTSLCLSDAYMASELIVIWFQEQPFPVPAESALQQLQVLAWESLARDFDY